MSVYLSPAQIIVSLLLIVSVLLQSRGSGLGSAFGGEGTVYRTRRGIERSLFISTIVLAIIFIVISFLNTVLGV
jgi:preprotein translocase subunit SecG